MNVRLAWTAVLPTLLCACGVEIASSGTPERQSQEPPRVTALTCQTDTRTMATIDFATSTGGAATPEAAAQILAKSEGEVNIQDQTQSRATAYLLRADGTAYSQLGLIVLDDDTWRIDTIESCEGAGHPR